MPNQSVLHRMMETGPRYLSVTELLQCLLGLSAQRADALAADREALIRLQPADSAGLRHKHGLSEHQTCLLATATELGRRLHEPPPGFVESVNSPSDADQILQPHLQGQIQEHLVTVALNTRNQVVGVHTVYIGTVNSSSVRPAEVLRPAVVANAPCIIVGHNHPSGDPTPSPEDASVTRDIRPAAELLSIELLDHIVVGANGRFTSMKEKRLGFQ